MRSIKPADKPQLMELLRNTPEFEPFEIPVAEEIIESSYNEPGQYYSTIVAEIGTAVKGFVCFGHTPLTVATWDIYWMAVAQDKRGLGIGRALLNKVEERIVSAGGKLVLVETSSKPNYLNTRRFYRHSGYKRIARIVDFYSPKDHLLILEKRF
ncbi:MAG: GNAT family N-acetyltransferase [Dehalococcoidia bacterium]|nr:GNAT family N-acetyltransferase [Dehalococcoidia bacterium]